MPDLNEIAKQKKLLRQEALARRARVSDQDRWTAGARIATLAIEAIAEESPRLISAFRSVRGEIDTGPLLDHLSNASAIIGLPVVIARSAPLVFRRWRAGDPIAAGPFGIEEPLPAAEEIEPDVLFVPLAAVDGDGYRIGYGGGFYDRTLAKLRARKPIVAIGLAFDAQVVDHVPREETDARLDALITPSGLRRFKGTACA